MCLRSGLMRLLGHPEFSLCPLTPLKLWEPSAVLHMHTRLLQCMHVHCRVGHGIIAGLARLVVLGFMFAYSVSALSQLLP